MASIDIYINETTRHADVILPPVSMLAHENYDIVFNSFAIRNVARHNPAVFAKPQGGRYDWEIFNGLGAAYSKAAGVEFKALPEPSAMVDAGLRAGPYALSLDVLKAAPHGVDLGPLKPSLTRRLETPDGKIACAPEAFVADLKRVEAELLDRRALPGELRLVGRRHLRSNNSWMHNSHRLTKGPRRDHLWIHPDDAASVGLVAGQLAELTSRRGTLRLPVRFNPGLSRGLVFVPFHWGDLYTPGNAVNYLTISATDNISRQPELKFCAVALEKIAAPKRCLSSDGTHGTDRTAEMEMIEMDGTHGTGKMEMGERMRWLGQKGRIG